MIKGGSWGLGQQFARSACREQRAPGFRNRGLGFRIARSQWAGGGWSAAYRCEREVSAGATVANIPVANGVRRVMPAATPAGDRRADAAAGPPASGVKLPPVSTNSFGMKFALIPAGEFMMGSPDDEQTVPEEKPLHRVRITKPFYT